MTHHIGHRKRLKDRFIHSPYHVQDYEIYEMLLFMIYKRHDVKAMAKTLYEIGWEKMIDCSNEKFIYITEVIKKIIFRFRQSMFHHNTILEKKSDIISFCQNNLSYSPIRILWLNIHFGLIGETYVNILDEKIIINAGLELKAAHFIITTLYEISPDRRIFEHLVECLRNINIHLNGFLVMEEYQENVI